MANPSKGPFDANTPNYPGTISALRMGSLLALPPSVNVNNLNLSYYGNKIAQAMQTYGTYVVDTTGDHWYYGNVGSTMSICAEESEGSGYFTSDNDDYSSANLYLDMAVIYPL